MTDASDFDPDSYNVWTGHTCDDKACGGKLFVQDADFYYEGEEYLAICDICRVRYSVEPEVPPVEFVNVHRLKDEEMVDHE